MPGPQDPSDQAAGAYGRGSDSPRRPDPPEGPVDRPARGSLTDLRQRLERLPPGHPSSPYHDDRSRKPPVIRLKDLELPLPGEAGTGETEAHQAHADEAHADDSYADNARGYSTYAPRRPRRETHAGETYAAKLTRRQADDAADAAARPTGRARAASDADGRPVRRG